MPELSDDDKRILDFERKWWKFAGAKDGEILHELHMSPTRYYLDLNRIIDDPAALAYDAQNVNRLRRLREARKRARS